MYALRLGGHLDVYQESLLGKRERRESHFVPVPREEFCSSKLAPKLAQQLKVVFLACFTGNMLFQGLAGHLLTSEISRTCWQSAVATCRRGRSC